MHEGVTLSEVLDSYYEVIASHFLKRQELFRNLLLPLLHVLNYQKQNP